MGRVTDCSKVGRGVPIDGDDSLVIVTLTTLPLTALAARLGCHVRELKTVLDRLGGKQGRRYHLAVDSPTAMRTLDAALKAAVKDLNTSES